MEFHTLVDFLIFSKGVAYLIGGAVVIGFVPFWLYLTEREEEGPGGLPR